MNIPEVLRALDAQIAQLQQVRQLLGDSASTSVPSAESLKRRGRPPGIAKAVAEKVKPAGKRTMSEEGKARIAAAQKKRWAKSKKAAKVAAAPPVVAKKSAPTATKTAPKKAAQAAAPAKIAAKKVAAPAKKLSARKTTPSAKRSIAQAPRSVEHIEPEQSPEMPETMEATAAKA